MLNYIFPFYIKPDGTKMQRSHSYTLRQQLIKQASKRKTNLMIRRRDIVPKPSKQYYPVLNARSIMDKGDTLDIIFKNLNTNAAIITETQLYRSVCRYNKIRCF